MLRIFENCKLIRVIELLTRRKIFESEHAKPVVGQSISFKESIAFTSGGEKKR